MTEPAFGEPIQPVRVAAGVERVGHQLRVIVVAKRDAVLGEYDGVEFDVEADLQNARRFQQRPQRLDRFAGLDLVRSDTGGEQAGAVAAGLLVAEWNVAGVVGRKRQRNAAHFRLHWIDGIGFGFEREMTDIVHPGGPGSKLVEIADRLVFAAIDLCLARGFGTSHGKALWSEDDVRSFRPAVSLSRYAHSAACGGGRAGNARGEKIAARVFTLGHIAGLVDLFCERKRSENTGGTLDAKVGLDIGRVYL